MSHQSTFQGFAARLRAFIALYSSPDSPTFRPSPDAEFDSLALELFALQYQHNAPYRRFCEARHVGPDTVRFWSAIPAIPVAAFKELELTSLPVDARTRVFHSSGTTGQTPSRHFHNAGSLALYEASLLPWFQRHLLPKGGAIKFISLTPLPRQAPHSSLVHMFVTVQRELGTPDSAFVGRAGDDGSWELDFNHTRKTLDEAIAANQPVTLLGTAFSFVHLLDHLAATNLRLRLPGGSRALETGGYKGRSRMLAKPDLHAFITERLGISPSHIVCEYGMSELSSQAYDSIAGQTQAASRAFHFPPWARVELISPETGRPVVEGETGLIRICDLANVWSVMALQTEDLGVRRGDGFELLGRATLAEAAVVP